MKIIGMFKSMVPRLFRWGLISRWLIALCLWAISMQLLYPVPTPWSFWGMINLMVVGMCLVVLLVRLVARFRPGNPIWVAINPILNVADIVALVFVLAGVLLYLNGVLGEPLPKIETVEVEEVLTESPRLGPWWPSGILKLKSNNSEFSGKYVLVDQQRLQTLFPGTSITLPVHQGAFGVPWVELEGIRPDVRESVAKLIGEREKDSLLVKWAIQNELSAQRFRQAVTMATTYFEQEPGDFYFAFTLAEGAVQNRNPAIAVQLLKPFVKRHYNYKLYSMFGYYLRISDDAVGSVDYLKAAVGIDPEEPEAYYLLGYTLKTQGYKDEALATFTKLIQLQPQYASMLEIALRDLNNVHLK